MPFLIIGVVKNRRLSDQAILAQKKKIFAIFEKNMVVFFFERNRFFDPKRIRPFIERLRRKLDRLSKLVERSAAI